MKRTPSHARQKKKSAPARAPLVPAASLHREAAVLAVCCALTIGLFSLIFPPIDFWPAAMLCLVPWAAATCRVQRTWLIYWMSLAAGWAFFALNLNWLRPVTGLGYVALAFYLGLYWPLAAWAIRTGRRRGVSPLWTLPVVWVACEFLRGWVMSGFPWLFLGHAFYQQLRFIQIADLVGAYGVTFIAALVNGLLVELVLRVWRPAEGRAGRRQFVAGTLATFAVLVGTLAYGAVRLSDTRFRPGPRIAVVQGDCPLWAAPPYSAPSQYVLASYLALAADAAAEQPDLLVFPETVWGATQNLDFLDVEHRAVDDISAGAWSYGLQSHRAVSAFAQGNYAEVNRVIAELETLLRRQFTVMDPEERHDTLRLMSQDTGPPVLPRLPEAGGPPVTVVVGSQALEVSPGTAYPPYRRYNSVLVYDPDGSQRRMRYDKNHLVPFGEYVPFRYGRLHWLYLRLNDLVPFSQGGRVEYSLSAGRGLTRFEALQEGGVLHFGTPICYEDVMPYVVRNYVWDGGRRRVDFLINVSNDGWFLHSAELPQHLAICVFRAVENRVGIARAVNTGISGFIDPNGRCYSLVRDDGRLYGPGVIGYRIDHVYLDSRASLYGRWGDAFALICVVLSAVLWLEAVCVRWVKSLRRRLSMLLRKVGWS